MNHKYYIIRFRGTGEILTHGTPPTIKDDMNMNDIRSTYNWLARIKRGEHYKLYCEEHDLPTFYTVYDKKDNIIASGSEQECSKILGYSAGCFYSALTKSRNGRLAKYTICADKMTEEEFWDEYIETNQIN